MRVHALIIGAVLLLPGIAAAAMTPEMQQKLESLTRESDAIARQRLRWEGVQKALLAQKAAIEAAQQQILQEQDSLNQRGAQHNQQAASHQQQLKKGGCGKDQDDGSGVSGGDLTQAQCDKDAKKMNADSAGLNAEAKDIQSQQDALSAKYAKANQDASDWNAHESQVTEQLNKVYGSMNDWLDKAYPLVTDDSFRDEVAARGAEAACENHGLPANMSIAEMKRLNEAYRKCLKTVLHAERAAPRRATGATLP